MDSAASVICSRRAKDVSGSTVQCLRRIAALLPRVGPFGSQTPEGRWPPGVRGLGWNCAAGRAEKDRSDGGGQRRNQLVGGRAMLRKDLLGEIEGDGGDVAGAGQVERGGGN